MSLWQERVTYPSRCRPLPPGYRVVQHDSGHYQWVLDGGPVEGLISWDRWWVRRCAFAHAEVDRIRKALAEYDSASGKTGGGTGT